MGSRTEDLHPIVPEDGDQERVRVNGADETEEGLLEKYLEVEEKFCRTNDQTAVRERSSCTPNTVWREMVCKWAYDVVDMLDESRSVVYVTMNILDRFCAVTQNQMPINEKSYEHASMTALYLAIRTAGSCNLQMTDLIHMSRDDVRPDDIVIMGKRMLRLLTWGPRLITPMDFVHVMLRCLPETVDKDSRNQLLQSASFLVEIAVCDLHLSRFGASEVAFAAILNAAQAESLLTPSEMTSFCEELRQTVSLDSASRQTRSVRIRLDSVYNRVEQDQELDNSPNYISDDEDSCSGSGSDYAVAFKRPREVASKGPVSKQQAQHHSRRVQSPVVDEDGERPNKRARRFSLSQYTNVHR